MSLITLQEQLRAGRSMARTLLLLLALTGAVILGLLAMHSLNTHGLGSHTDGSTTMLVSAVETAHDGEHHSAAAATEQECADCGTSDADMMAMACILALLVTVLLLARPRQPLGGRVAPHRGPDLAVIQVIRVEPRPPSLNVLCISRT